MLLYVAGPYSAPTEEGIQANIQAASEIAEELWRRGHAVICPHKNGAGFHLTVPELSFDDWLRGDCQMIAACDGIVFLQGWETSRGSQVEMKYAKSLGIPIWYVPYLPKLHTTEIKSPIQVKAFREMLGKMMRTHLDKNASYSPLNVAGPGMIGIGTRIWDKCTRLLNLIGFDITMHYEDDGTITVKIGPKFQPKETKYEPLEDTLLDLAVYGIIGKLNLEGKWGK